MPRKKAILQNEMIQKYLQAKIKIKLSFKRDLITLQNVYYYFLALEATSTIRK